LIIFDFTYLKMSAFHSITDFNLPENNPIITALKAESYNNWRSNSRQKLFREKNFLIFSKEKQKNPHLSYNFKLTHSSSEYQDNYLQTKNFNRIENKFMTASVIKLQGNKNEGLQQNETDTKKIIERMEKKTNNFNPEINMFNIMKAVTKELDDDEEIRGLKEKSRPVNKSEMLQRIKANSLHTIQESIKQIEVEKMKTFTKTQITKISNEMSYLLDKSEKQKFSKKFFSF